eukprot:SAG11_NODE_17510_length_516_cov_0.868106_1_plen_41_part_01
MMLFFVLNVWQKTYGKLVLGTSHHRFSHCGAPPAGCMHESG